MSIRQTSNSKTGSRRRFRWALALFNRAYWKLSITRRYQDLFDALWKAPFRFASSHCSQSSALWRLFIRELLYSEWERKDSSLHIGRPPVKGGSAEVGACGTHPGPVTERGSFRPPATNQTTNQLIKIWRTIRFALQSAWKRVSYFIRLYHSFAGTNFYTRAGRLRITSESTLWNPHCGIHTITPCSSRGKKL